MAVPKSDTWEGSVEMPKPENGSHAEEVQEGSVAISIAKPEGSTTLSPTKGEGRAGTAASGHLENAHDGATLNPDIPAQEAGAGRYCPTLVGCCFAMPVYSFSQADSMHLAENPDSRWPKSP